MGLFTAGVSRGRSLRELVLAVAILCPLVTNLWFTLLGGTGMALELSQSGSVSGPLAANGAAAALLAILSQLPLAWLLIPIGLLLVVLFMATSADSMSYAAAMVVSGEREPAPWLRLFWALMIGSLTLVLLRIGSNLGDSTSPGLEGVETHQSVTVIGQDHAALIQSTRGSVLPGLAAAPNAEVFGRNDWQEASGASKHTDKCSVSWCFGLVMVYAKK